MAEYSQPLGNTVRKSRKDKGLTQRTVANRLNIDVRTIMNIENQKANPRMDVLFPLIRLLKIDPREIFYPEEKQVGQSLQLLRFFVDNCSEEEAADLLPIVQSVLNVLRSKKNNEEK